MPSSADQKEDRDYNDFIYIYIQSCLMTFRPLSPSSRSSGRDQSETRSLLAVDAESGRTWTFLLATGRYLHGKGVGGRGGCGLCTLFLIFYRG